MAKKKKRRGGKNPTATLFKLVRLAALAAPAIAIAAQPLTASQKIDRGLQAYTGYSTEQRNWSGHRLIQGWAPYLGAVLATYGIPKLVSIIRRL